MKELFYFSITLYYLVLQIFIIGSGFDLSKQSFLILHPLSVKKRYFRLHVSTLYIQHYQAQAKSSVILENLCYSDTSHPK